MYTWKSHNYLHHDGITFEIVAAITTASWYTPRTQNACQTVTRARKRGQFVTDLQLCNYKTKLQANCNIYIDIESQIKETKNLTSHHNAHRICPNNNSNNNNNLTPLGMVFTIIYLKLTMFHGYIMLQLFCGYHICSTCNVISHDKRLTAKCSSAHVFLRIVLLPILGMRICYYYYYYHHHHHPHSLLHSSSAVLTTVRSHWPNTSYSLFCQKLTRRHVLSIYCFLN